MSKLFNNLLKHIGNLSQIEKERVFQWVKRYVEPSSSVGGRLINEMRETRFKEGFECPHCASEHVVRFGKYNGRQRYRCTLFYWRHKLLSALKQMDFEQFDGIVEVDETYFLYSQKGQRGITERNPRKRGGKSKHRGISHEQVCVLVARDRTKATVSKVACMGRFVKTKVDTLIGSKLTPNNVLVTDAWRAYKTYAKEKGIEHYRIKSTDGKHVIKGLYHIQNVNGLHSRMKQWIDRFKGVATKYLDNYLAWFLFVDSRSNESTKHNIKEFLLSSFVNKMTDTYESLRLSKFIV